MSQTIWGPPEGLFGASDRLEQLIALINFITDLSAQGGPALGGEYPFSTGGIHGLSLFLYLIEEEMEGIQAIILEEHKQKREEDKRCMS